MIKPVGAFLLDLLFIGKFKEPLRIYVLALPMLMS